DSSSLAASPTSTSSRSASVAEARLVCRSVMVEPTDGGSPFVYVDLAIDCPDCGTYLVQLGGHHLRAIRDFLIQTIDDYPALTGKDAPAAETVRLRGPGNDPTTS